MSTIERFDLEFGIVTQVGGKQISKLSVTHVRIRTGGGAPASPNFFVTPKGLRVPKRLRYTDEIWYGNMWGRSVFIGGQSRL